MKKLAVATVGVSAIALAFAAKDPVIMTVNGEDVPKSEFEYLYNKNSQQQINPQTLEEYVEMFKLYKMKVADARAEGLDTMASFIRETEQYRHELAAPYLADSVYINQLVDAAYDRSKEEVEARHIMLFKTRDSKRNRELRHKADSLRAELLRTGDFEGIARKNSEDRGSLTKGGRMGWISANSYPQEFEDVAFTLPEGQISEVIETPMGYHILKGGKHRKARGKVLAAHILKLTQAKGPEDKVKAKHDIDSLYNVVKGHPELFATVAQANSDDKASARNGGQLPWFGAGEMIEAFDSVAFALKNGEISEPLETEFGWHIIYRMDAKDIPSANEIKPQIIKQMQSPADPRHRMIRSRQNEKLAKKHKASVNRKTLEAMRKDLTRNGIDSLYLANWTTMPSSYEPVATVSGKTAKAKDFVSTMAQVREEEPEAAAKLFDDRFDAFYNSLLVNAEEDALAISEPDYRNLLKEYVDGSLLYEVSVRKVWDKAAKDTEGLEKYFAAHRDNYKWTEPHVKGFLVQAVNDSVAQLIRNRAAELGKDSLVNTIRKEFSGSAGIDRVLVGKGSNAVIDYLIFGGPEVKPSNARYTVSFMIDPRIIMEPEEVNDVKGLVTSDYQNEFQENWEKELRSRYPVKVNEKVLKEVRRREGK